MPVSYLSSRRGLLGSSAAVQLSLLGCASSRDRLATALESGRRGEVAAALAADDRDWFAFDELLTAIRLGQLRNTTLLLEAGAPLSHPRWVTTAITFAALHGKVDLLAPILARGAKVDDQETSLLLDPPSTVEPLPWPKEYQLHRYVDLGDLYKLFMEMKLKPLERLDELGMRNSGLQTTNCRLVHAPNIGHSALSRAIVQEQPAMVEALLQRGAKVNYSVVSAYPDFAILNVVSFEERSKLMHTQNVDVVARRDLDQFYFKKIGVKVVTNTRVTPHVISDIRSMAGRSSNSRIRALLSQS